MRTLLNTKQLPPISSNDDNHVLDNPHIFLDEIMRQAAESEIIRLSMHIREGKPVNTFQASGSEVLIYRPQEVIPAMLTWGDQNLCATNKTRFSLNEKIRQLNNFDPLPQIGDRVISLHNQWDHLATNGEVPLTNGTIGTIIRMDKSNIYFPSWICNKPISVLYVDLQTDDGTIFINVPIDYQSLVSNVKSLTGEQEFQLRKLSRKNKSIVLPYEFAYAYAITTWKAQGSEWGKILGFEESFPFDAETHKRYLYTMATRASNKLVLITK